MAAKRYDVFPGETYGCFRVLSYAFKGTWICECMRCGGSSMRRGNALHTGKNRWCKGCIAADVTSRNSVKHKREYFVWAAMKQRCFNLKDRAYVNYGGRGITVCDRWKVSFEAFLEDMGKCPDGRSLDRRDNDGNYEPSNCRWATWKEQNRNTRKNRQITFKGRTQTLAEWAEDIGLTWAGLYSRIKRGWTVERALTESVHTEKQPK